MDIPSTPGAPWFAFTCCQAERRLARASRSKGGPRGDLVHQPPPDELRDGRAPRVHHPRQRLGDAQQRPQHPHRGHHVLVPDAEVTDDVGAALRYPFFDDLSALVAAGADGQVRAAGGDLQGRRPQLGVVAGLAGGPGLGKMVW